MKWLKGEINASQALEGRCLKVQCMVEKMYCRFLNDGERFYEKEIRKRKKTILYIPQAFVNKRHTQKRTERESDEINLFPSHGRWEIQQRVSERSERNDINIYFLWQNCERHHQRRFNRFP